MLGQIVKVSVVFLRAAPLWPSLLVDYTSFSKQDLVSLAVLLYVKWCVLVFSFFLSHSPFGRKRLIAPKLT